VTLMLHFADCVPVIVFDRKKRVAAIFHAGWKGTAARIAGRGVETMCAEFGSNPADMVAAVGPGIGSCCYQTGEDVALALSESIKEPAGLITMNDGKPYPDLKFINAQQLFEAGVAEVEVSNHCTACDPGMFYSHRQSGGTTGRQGALICLTA
jgi:YfiH family protein